MAYFTGSTIFPSDPNYPGIPCNSTETPGQCLSMPATLAICFGVLAFTTFTLCVAKRCYDKFSIDLDSVSTEKTKLVASGIL